MPEERKKGKISAKIFEKNHGLRQAWFGAWYPKPDDEYCIIIGNVKQLNVFTYSAI